MVENPIKIEEKLALTKYVTDKNFAHITINEEICKTKCKTYDCVYGCPAECYKLVEDGDVPVTFDYAPCVECGTCRLVCPHRSVDWHYPHGGFGVEFKMS